MQFSYNKHGLSNFIFEVIESTTKELVKERELFWFNHFKSNDVILFNHDIVESKGGTDSKSCKTRLYIFKIISEMHSSSTGIKQGSKNFKTSTCTIMKYIPEWEVITGLTFCRNPQVASTLRNMEIFVEAWWVQGDAATKRLKDFKLSHQSLVKYLPNFGLSFEDVRLDKKSKDTKRRALLVIDCISNGSHVEDACIKFNISIPSYYKYLKETTTLTSPFQ